MFISVGRLGMIPCIILLLIDWVFGRMSSNVGWLPLSDTFKFFFLLFFFLYKPARPCSYRLEHRECCILNEFAITSIVAFRRSTAPGPYAM